MRQRLISTNSANGRLHLSGVLVAALLGLVATSGIASAQVATVREIVDLLVTNQSVQTGDFVKDRAAAEAASAALGQALLVSLTTLPTGRRVGSAAAIPVRATTPEAVVVPLQYAVAENGSWLPGRGPPPCAIDSQNELRESNIWSSYISRKPAMAARPAATA